MSGGQPDGARLLELARRELLEKVLAEASGETRYRLRLIANAMKIAGNELAAGSAAPAEASEALRAFAGTALRSGPGTLDQATAAAALRDALRSGELDGSAELYALLVDLTAARRRLLT